VAKLTPKQEMFVREYLKDMNATQAAIRAGYSKKTAFVIGNENLNKPYLKRAIIDANKERVARVALDADWVLTRLKLISDRCTQGEPVVDNKGNPTGEWKFDSAGANRATELIGKHLTMFTDRQEISGKDGESLQVQFNIPRPGQKEKPGEPG